MKTKSEWEQWNRERLNKAKAKVSSAASVVVRIEGQLENQEFHYSKYCKDVVRNSKGKNSTKLPVPKPDEIPVDVKKEGILGTIENFLDTE